jgi:leucyl/phenylalanyl-tRNA--protein transferase
MTSDFSDQTYSDRALPYFDEKTHIVFPPVESSTPEGIVMVGGNLSPGMLLSAYRQGIFPWYSEGDPILWWSPDPRCVLFPEEVHVSGSMNKIFRKNIFRITFDKCFREVITACRETPRSGQDGTWITPDMLDSYVTLHKQGYAHSVEVWAGSSLEGGLYGISLGSCFFAESMFTWKSNSSKFALISLARLLVKMRFSLIDCQVYSPHLETMGARMITRREFLARIKECLEDETKKGSWKNWGGNVDGAADQ